MSNDTTATVQISQEEMNDLLKVFNKEESERVQKQVGTDLLTPDDYIIKVAKIELEKFATWNPSLHGKGGFDYTKKKLEYNIVGLVYKPKAEDQIIGSSQQIIKPLSTFVFKRISSFSTGVNQKTGTPTFMRAFIAFILGKNPSIEAQENISAPGILVFNPASDLATEEETKKYLQEFLAFRKGKIPYEKFTMRVAGFFEVPDIRPFEGKYIGASIGAKNRIEKFSKVPSNFIPDPVLESEMMLKFHTTYAKMKQKQQQNEQEFFKILAGGKSTIPQSYVNESDTLIIDPPNF